MPIRLADLENDERTCEVEYEGETGNITYRPSLYTPALEDEYQTSMETNRPTGAMCKMLAKILVAWEVLDEEGEPIAIEFEVLRQLPGRFITVMMNAITSDILASRDKEVRKNSGGGSRRRASRGKSLSGTR